jgi:catechol 2,3-dioxygenase-like lactoylglutathione lyase family enzyme
MSIRLQHCGLVVSDLERSRRFYGEALGLEELSRPSNFAFAGAWFALADTELHLLAEADTTSRAGMPPPGPAIAGGLATHLALEVEDLPAWQARLGAHGVEPAAGPMPRGDGVDQLFVLDPDGYVVELFERTGQDQADAPERSPIRARD